MGAYRKVFLVQILLYDYLSYIFSVDGLDVKLQGFLPFHFLQIVSQDQKIWELTIWREKPLQSEKNHLVSNKHQYL